MKIIAELGNTHEGSVGLAKCMIKAAKDCGADIAKLQTHIFGAESRVDAPNPPYFSGESRKEYFERTSFSKEQYLELIDYSKSIGIEVISSPFSVEALLFLIDLGMTTIKIPSGEMSNILLLNELAKHDVHVILSSGMSSIKELDIAMDILKKGNSRTLTLLQCTSEYPCPPETVGLNNINFLNERYNVPVGFSDHTLSESIPAIAVYAGATVIEKHLTLSKLAYGSDAANSLEPDEFKRMVGYISEAVILSQTHTKKETSSDYISNMKVIFEKSLVYSQDFKAGHVLRYEDFAAKKPGDGLSTNEIYSLIGKTLKKDTFFDEKVNHEDSE